jgi:hypothetical protein
MKRALWLLLFLSIPLSAGVIYTYHGNNFTSIGGDPLLLNSSDAITVSFTVPAVLPAGYNIQYHDRQGKIIGTNNLGEPVEAWSMSDGNYTNVPILDSLDLSLWVDSSGNITNWVIDSFNNANTEPIFVDMYTDSSLPGLNNADASQYWNPPGTSLAAAQSYVQGSWTITGGTPEPGTWSLTLLGLLAVAKVRMMRTSQPLSRH